MKKLLLAIILLFSNILIAQTGELTLDEPVDEPTSEFHDTQGKLEVSSNGQAIYTLPIALPPSIQDIGPTINLTYSSGQMGGIAGQGWNINNISAISRISTRIDVDGYIDGVDFDLNDKLALDGQRLVLINGNYWENGSLYATEVHSNTKIELIGSGTGIYFIATQPDGSRSWYGNFGGTDARDLTSYYITRFEDTNGNFITYHYLKPINKSLCIDEIKFSANLNGTMTAQNKIKFSYTNSQRIESGYLKGIKYEKAEILIKIQVFTNNNLFREYRLTHLQDSQLGYERVKQIQEFNGSLEPANPVIFNYETTATKVGFEAEKVTNYNNNLNFNEISLSGDFDGDSRLDFITSEGLFRNLFQGTSGEAPIPLPWNLVAGRPPFIATTLSNNKLNQFSSLVLPNETVNNLELKVYNLNNLNFDLSYIKTFPITSLNTGQCYDECSGGQYCEDVYGSNYINKFNKFLEGDFNGDGISEVLILNYSHYTSFSMEDYGGYYENEPPFCQQSSGMSYLLGAYIGDLNPTSSTTLGSKGFVQINPSFFNAYSPKQVADFNGDGKSDIIQFNNNGDYIVIGFKQLLAAPWVELEILGQGNMDKFSSNKNLLYGDYNADGKTDIMLPDTEKGGSNQTLWHIYYANPQPNGGSFFIKESHNICEHWPNTENYYNTQTHFSSYYSIDVNGDGKSDLVRVWRKYYKPQYTINDHDTQWKIYSYANNIGNSLIGINQNKFTLDYESTSTHNSDFPDLVIPIASNYKFANLNNDLIIVHNYYKKVTFFDFGKDVKKDIRLRSVSSSTGGSIIDTIDYKSMESQSQNLPLHGFYSSSNSVDYPFVELKRLPENLLVSKVTNITAGVTRSQDFSYNGLIVNLHGLGTIGFNKTARSSWYEGNYTGNKIWATTENRSDLRGATVRSYTSYVNSNGGFRFFDSNTVNIPNVLSTDLNNFTVNTINGIYKLQLDKRTKKDYLTSVSNETSYLYDNSGYLLPETVITKNFNNISSTPESTTTITTAFSNNPNGLEGDYFIGRPNQINKSISNNIDIFSTVDKLFYSNNKLVKTEKKGNTNDNKFLIEEFDYFPNGNIKKKTIYTTGYSGIFVITPRITEFTYDSSERYIKTSKDVQGLISTNISFHPLYGEVTQSQNPYGLNTNTLLDNWGKVLKITDYLGKNTNLFYSKVGLDSYILKVSEDGSASLIVSDLFGRTKISGNKNLNDNWSYHTTIYDNFGRIQKESEPHNEIQNPNQWTIFSYDDYNRQSSITNPSGLTTNITYSLLTITGTDGVKTTSSTKNANGQVISTSDNGGTINHSYYANGNLKLSNYNGAIVGEQYDEWGRRSNLNDSSAGVYTYTQNALGELLVATTPNGTTTNNYDDFGNLVASKIIGLNTDNLTTYVYSTTTKQLTSVHHVDNNNAGIYDDYNYEYDSFQRIFRISENKFGNFYQTATFYDSFGRPEKELYTAISGNKSSSKWIRNTYKNGFKWQIFDDVSNQLLWQNNTVNQRSQITSATYGNNITINNSYDQYGFPSQIKHDKTGSSSLNVMTLNTNFDPLRGNLTFRDNNLFNWSENFQYDNLDRLKNYKDVKGLVVNQDYELDGRIKNNTLGSYNYSNTAKKYQNTSINVNEESKSYYENRLGIFNDGMENADSWNIYEPLFITFDNSVPAHSGNISLKIENTSPEEKVIHSNKWIKIDNAVPTNYTYSVWVKSNGSNPQAQLFLFMKTDTETGYFTLVDDKVVATNNNWTLIEKTFLVPANIKKLSIRLDNNSIGTLWFDDVRIRKTSDDSQERNLNISYNTWKSPYQIEETGIDKINFTYNKDNNRSAMYYGGLQNDKYQRQFIKYYSADGSMEIKQNNTTGETEFITYIGGDAYSAPVVLKSNGTTQEYLYLHRDFQGSIIAITNQNAQIVEKRLFDAWGEIIKVLDGQGNILTQLTILDRGYTGHEHLQTVGLINMNGRIYDAKLHRFLQPDNYIQDPHNTQNYNRYAYVLNNPLKYTDPSGEFGVLAAIGVGVFIAATTYTVTALLADVPFNVGGLVKASFMGALSGAVTFGIGEVALTIKPLVTRFVFQALAHGTFQGGLGYVQGGNFWQGFASGSLASIASSLYSGGGMANGNAWNGLGGKFSSSATGILSFGTISGGLGASLSGGNFWQGAATGLIVSGLNHLAHNLIDPIEKKLNHEETIKYFKNEIKSYEDGIDSLNNILNAVGGDLSLGGIIRDLWTGTFKLTIASIAATHLKVEIKILERNLTTLRQIKQNYDDIHAKYPGNSKGISIQETSFSMKSSVYGGFNPNHNYIQYSDNYRQKALGTIITR